MGYAAKLGSSGKGKLAVVNLGTGTSINCSTHAVLKDYYTELTVDNFYYRLSSKSGTSQDGASRQVTLTFTPPSISYNKNTGVLSVGNCTVKASHSGWSTYIYPSRTSYCIYLE